jgi:hypothetical protein
VATSASRSWSPKWRLTMSATTALDLVERYRGWNGLAEVA